MKVNAKGVVILKVVKDLTLSTNKILHYVQNDRTQFSSFFVLGTGVGVNMKVTACFSVILNAVKDIYFVQDDRKNWLVSRSGEPWEF